MRAVLLTALLLSGCLPSFPDDCGSGADCPTGRECIGGQCTLVTSGEAGTIDRGHDDGPDVDPDDGVAPGTETCNGIDDDLDTVTDEGDACRCVAVGAPVRFDTLGGPGRPDLVAGGVDLGVIWRAMHDDGGEAGPRPALFLATAPNGHTLLHVGEADATFDDPVLVATSTSFIAAAIERRPDSSRVLVWSNPNAQPQTVEVDTPSPLALAPFATSANEAVLLYTARGGDGRRTLRAIIVTAGAERITEVAIGPAGLSYAETPGPAIAPVGDRRVAVAVPVTDGDAGAALVHVGQLFANAQGAPALALSPDTVAFDGPLADLALTAGPTRTEPVVGRWLLLGGVIRGAQNWGTRVHRLFLGEGGAGFELGGEVVRTGVPAETRLSIVSRGDSLLSFETGMVGDRVQVAAQIFSADAERRGPSWAIGELSTGAGAVRAVVREDDVRVGWLVDPATPDIDSSGLFLRTVRCPVPDSP
ncbi:MAG: hypothetical protein KC620_03850 [Myxococcales bacterium]|nr:hypothetical protein [Myxococcales bacterium]